MFTNCPESWGRGHLEASLQWRQWELETWMWVLGARSNTQSWQTPAVWCRLCLVNPEKIRHLEYFPQGNRSREAWREPTSLPILCSVANRTNCSGSGIWIGYCDSAWDLTPGDQEGESWQATAAAKDWLFLQPVGPWETPRVQSPSIDWHLQDCIVFLSFSFVLPLPFLMMYFVHKMLS